jgi:hypothetical protein
VVRLKTELEKGDINAQWRLKMIVYGIIIAVVIIIATIMIWLKSDIKRPVDGEVSENSEVRKEWIGKK